MVPSSCVTLHALTDFELVARNALSQLDKFARPMQDFFQRIPYLQCAERHTPQPEGFDKSKF